MDQINEYKVDKINLVKAVNPRILHIGNFNEKNSHRLFNISISNKLTSGFIRNNCDVLNFDYRDYSNSNLFFDKLKKIKEIKAKRRILKQMKKEMKLKKTTKKMMIAMKNSN